MSRFAAIPAVPTSNVAEWQSAVLNALKENVELLCGTRGESDLQSRAVVGGNVGVQQITDVKFTRVSATGAGYTISGVNVSSVDDFTKLILDVNLLSQDVATLRSTLNALIAQLKG